MKNFLCLALLFSLIAVPARADIAVNGDCTGQLGVSTITTDKANIVTCLQKSGTDTALIWKSTTGGGGDEGTWCGLVVYRVYDNTPAGSATVSREFTCNGRRLLSCNGQWMSEQGTGYPTCPYGVNPNCPTGYTMKSTAENAEIAGCNELGWDCVGNNHSYTRTCVKD